MIKKLHEAFKAAMERGVDPVSYTHLVKELVLAGMLLASRDIAGGIEWVKSDKEDGDIAKTCLLYTSRCV